MAIATLRIGPADHGRAMTLRQFARADFEEGWLYELARGVIDVTEVPGVPHGRIVDRITEMFIFYRARHAGVINYRANASECRLRLPGMQSDRHPDQAIYLTPPPGGRDPWARWIPEIVIEVVSRGGEQRDYIEKREEYLNAGVVEYWVLDPSKRELRVHLRAGDTWSERIVPESKTYRTRLLPGLVVRPGELLGPAK
jgi:Uma2 family endonuclease